MRVAAVALVLLVGAVAVLILANTLNAWVLGGLLGGLAAILISIPVSLALFTLLARRHDARQLEHEQRFAHEEEPHFADELEEDRLVYEAEGYTLPEEEDVLAEPEPRFTESRRSVAGYLPAPAFTEDEADYLDEFAEEQTLVRRDPRNYPRQPRYPVRQLDPSSLTPRSSPPARQDTRVPRPTSSLAQHQSAALRQAKQEAQQQVERRTGSSGRTSQERSSTGSTRRVRPGQAQRPGPASSRTTASQHSLRNQDDWASRQERIWRSLDEEETLYDERFTTGHTRTEHTTADYRSQHYPRRPDYPRRPRQARQVEPETDHFADQDEDEFQEERAMRRSRAVTNRPSGDMRNPVVRRAPFLYQDDPLRDEFARQLGTERPITRRSTRSEQYEDDDEYR
jgi:hypothetical protein